jgi:hypothetical protein
VSQFLSKSLHANRSLSHANRVSGRCLPRAPGNGFRMPETEGYKLPPCRDWKPTYSPPQNRGYSANARKSRLAQECVVGLVGLEPPTRPLWRDAPAPRTPQWDIFDWPGQEERACDVGSTVETSVPMPEPGGVPASGSGGASVAH